MDLEPVLKWALVFFVLVSCARLSWSHSAFEFLSYHIISYQLGRSSQNWPI